MGYDNGLSDISRHPRLFTFGPLWSLEGACRLAERYVPIRGGAPESQRSHKNRLPCLESRDKLSSGCITCIHCPANHSARLASQSKFCKP